MAEEISGVSAGSEVSIGEGAKMLLGGLAVHFKLRAGQTGGQLSMSEVTLDPHRLVPPHVHADEDEYAYVAAGTIGVRVGDEEFEAPQGSYFGVAANGGHRVPPGISCGSGLAGRMTHGSSASGPRSAGRARLSGDRAAAQRGVPGELRGRHHPRRAFLGVGGAAARH